MTIWTEDRYRTLRKKSRFRTNGLKSFMTLLLLFSSVFIFEISRPKVVNGWNVTTSIPRGISQVSCSYESLCAALSSIGEPTIEIGNNWKEFPEIRGSDISCTTNSHCILFKNNKFNNASIYEFSTSNNRISYNRVASLKGSGVLVSTCIHGEVCLLFSNSNLSNGSYYTKFTPSKKNVWGKRITFSGNVSKGGVSCSSESLCGVNFINGKSAILLNNDLNPVGKIDSMGSSTVVSCSTSNTCYFGTSNGNIYKFNESVGELKGPYGVRAEKISGLSCFIHSCLVVTTNSNSISNLYSYDPKKNESTLIYSSVILDAINSFSCDSDLNCYAVGQKSGTLYHLKHV